MIAHGCQRFPPSGVWLWLVAALAALVGAAGAAEVGSEDVFKAYKMPVVRGFVHLCQQRVYLGRGEPHITWDALSSDDPPSVVMTALIKQLGEEGLEREGDGGTWRLPPGDKPVRTLSVQPASSSGPHQQCDKKPPPGAQTVVILSSIG